MVNLIPDNNSFSFRTLGIVLLIGSLSWLVFIQRPLHSDDAGFMLVAKSFGNLRTFSVSHYAYKLGFLLPLIALNKILGFSLLSYYLFAYLSYLVFLVGCFALASYCFNWKVGLTAVVLCTSSLVLNLYSSVVLTDLPCTGFNLLALYCFLVSSDRNSAKRFDRWVLFSALCAFQGYQCKMTTAVFLIALPLYEVIAHRRLRKSMAFGVLFVLGVVLECMFNWWMHDAPLARFAVIYRAAGANVTNVPTCGSLWEFIVRAPRGFWLVPHCGWGLKFIIVAGILAFAGTIYRKEKKTLALAAGALVVYAMYAYSIGSWSPLKPASFFCVRHYYIPIVFLVIMAARLIWKVAEFLSRRMHLSLGITALVITAVLGILQYEEQYQRKANLIIRGTPDIIWEAGEAFGEVLKTHPEIRKATVYVLAEKNFGFYPNFNQLKLLDAERNGRPDAPCYVLTRERYISFYNDLFSNLGNDKVVEHFLSLLRPTKYFKPVYHDNNGIICAYVEKWVERKEEVYSLPRALRSVDADSLISCLSNKVKVEQSEKTVSLDFSQVELSKQQFVVQTDRFLDGRTGLSSSLRGALIQVEFRIRMQGADWGELGSYSNRDVLQMRICQFAGPKELDTLLSSIGPLHIDKSGDTLNLTKRREFRLHSEANRIVVRFSVVNQECGKLTLEDLRIYRFVE